MNNLFLCQQRSFYKLLTYAFCLALLIFCSSCEQDRRPFSLVVLPDTQGYSQGRPEIFTSQTQWVKDNKDALNIVFVLHEGDITNDNKDLEWERADASMSILDGVVPYTLCPGNHDVPNHGKSAADSRCTDKFNKIFSVSRFENEPWWGGYDPDDPDSRYVFFEAAGMEFMIVSLEFGPTDAMLDWANKIVAEHKEKRVIVLTHCYMYHDDTRSGPGDETNSKGWDNFKANDGEDMWEEFVKHHENIFLVLSGHIPVDDMLGRLTSTGAGGNKVHQILVNYQSLENAGNGWLQIMTFVPQDNKIESSTYSPWLDKWAEDEQNQFNLLYPMK